MLQKKSKKADLENSRAIFSKIGLVVALSLTLLAFEWKSKPDVGTADRFFVETVFDEDVIFSIPREEKKPEIVQARVLEILNIVPNDVAIDKEFIDFNPEVKPGAGINFDYIYNDREKIIDDPPFIAVEDMPLFNGGKPEKEFVKYISQNLEYPGIPAENGVGGRVIVQFVVNEKGKIVDAHIIVSVDPELDKEALRVINSSPLWTPGKQRGKPVKVLYTFPINFVLQ